MITGGGVLLQPAGHEYTRQKGQWGWTIIYLGTGTMTYDLCDVEGAHMEGGPRQLVLAKPGTLYREHTPTPVDEIYIHFQPRDMIQSFLAWPELVPGLMRLDVKGADVTAIRSSLTAAIRLTGRGLPETDLLAENALERALLLASLSNPNRSRGPLDPRIAKAMSLVADDLTAPLTVRDLAGRVGMSPSRFAHSFRAQVGVAPAEYVETQRIERAKNLLLHASLSVKEIAACTGFANPCHFSTRFRKATGLAPSTFRAEAGSIRQQLVRERRSGAGRG